ncbi:putative aldehyde reductase 2 [Xylaria castorea]|nr:putative aldehyde reductase 2 [Xylaria castorea]
MKISSPTIPPGSVVVVIGANGYIGYIGLEVCQKLLETGYRVRGTVRDIERCNWMHRIFDKNWPGQFELVRFQNFATDGAFDQAFEGAAGVLYISTPMIFDPDPAKVVEPTVNGTLNILNAAARAKVQRFVLNGSSKAVETTVYNQPHELTTKTFNHEALRKARNEPASPMFQRSFDVYSAGRTAAELAFWSWIEENKPPFVANCVVPDGNFGRVLGREHAGQGSSFGMLKRALAGEWTDVFPYLAYYIDVEDCARLLVAALALSSVKSERIFAYYSNGTWNDLRHKVRELFPDRPDIVTGEDFTVEGRDLSTAHEPIQRAKRILQEVGQQGFVSEDDMLRKFVESMYKNNE